MKLVIQRIKKAQVLEKESGNIVGQISQGLFVLLGVTQTDNEKVVDLLVDKLLKLRIMSDQNDKMNLSIQDIKGEILVVSQFTLYADTKGGRRPSFVNAAPPELARELYQKFVDALKKSGLKVETGSFGNYMEIESVVDGPVTILIEESAAKD